MEGQQISEITTIPSMYNNECIEAKIGRKWYRLPCSTILQMVNEFRFDVEKKKVHSYLINPQRIK
jgi:hypothetical protein